MNVFLSINHSRVTESGCLIKVRFWYALGWLLLMMFFEVGREISCLWANICYWLRIFIFLYVCSQFSLILLLDCFTEVKAWRPIQLSESPLRIWLIFLGGEGSYLPVEGSKYIGLGLTCDSEQRDSAKDSLALAKEMSSRDGQVWSRPLTLSPHLVTWLSRLGWTSLTKRHSLWQWPMKRDSSLCTGISATGLMLGAMGEKNNSAFIQNLSKRIQMCPFNTSTHHPNSFL